MDPDLHKKIRRSLQDHLEEVLQYFRIVYVGGPRQSGKTTLLKSALSHYQYYNLEHPTTRSAI
ncbi:MAG: hypothetical protein KTR24_13150, partial [Saprospiraceae bacterium]|nr:hypothetical protein [Saprospiraceae bacterium]